MTDYFFVDSRPRKLLGAGIAWAALLTAAVSAPNGSAASTLRKTPIVRAVEAARPSVVNIHGRKTVHVGQTPQVPGSDRQVNGMGTGIVIDERGYILTNYHVVEGVSRIQVTLASSETAIAELINHDPKTDLAVIKISVSGPLPVIKTGTSSDLMTGEPVIAVGNAYGYEHTVTRGIISALHRTVQVSDQQHYLDLIQTDASINPGNSGGPLLNIDGEMIGINVAVRVGAQGIGFAIPVDEAMEVAARLISAEELGRISHGIVGESRIGPSERRFVVKAVRAGSPAQSTGLKPGDVITHVAGNKVERSLDVERFLLDCEEGEDVELTIQRDEESLTSKLVLDKGLVAESPVAEQTWLTLGLKLAPVPQNVFRQYNSRYRGGLKVVALRGDGPAAKQGIQTGDVLVGLHKWETISLDNLAYILNSDEIDPSQSVRFYILRGGETRYGQIRLVRGLSGR